MHISAQMKKGTFQPEPGEEIRPTWPARPAGPGPGERSRASDPAALTEGLSHDPACGGLGSGASPQGGECRASCMEAGVVRVGVVDFDCLHGQRV